MGFFCRFASFAYSKRPDAVNLTYTKAKTMCDLSRNSSTKSPTAYVTIPSIYIYRKEYLIYI